MEKIKGSENEMGRKPKNIEKPKKETIKLNCNCETHKGSNPLDSSNFYNSNSPLFGENHKVSICKKCINNMIDYNNMETIYKVLQVMDLPFNYNLWDKTVIKNPKTPFGNYVRQINSLPQFKNLRWGDSSFDSSNSKNIVIIDENNEEVVRKVTYNEEWRGTYTKSDLDYLEKYYEDLNRDFKIVTRNHKDYARKIAKASLAMDRAYDDMINGVQGADTRYKNLKDTFDQLSKSAQFAEDKRGANEVGLGCFGVVFDKVEKKQWIPEHKPLKKDDIDKMIDSFGVIDKSL